MSIQDTLRGPQTQPTIDVPSIQVGRPQGTPIGTPMGQPMGTPMGTPMGRREQEQAAREAQVAAREAQVAALKAQVAARKAQANVVQGNGYTNVKGASNGGGRGYEAAVKQNKKPGFLSRFFQFDQNGDGKVTFQDIVVWIVKIPSILAHPAVQLMLPIAVIVVGGYVNLNAWMSAALQANANWAIAVLIWGVFTFYECRHWIDMMTIQSRVAKLIRASETPGLLPKLDELKTPEARKMMRDFANGKKESTSTMSLFVTAGICLIEAYVVSNGRSLTEWLDPFTAMTLIFTVASVPLGVVIYGQIANKLLDGPQRSKVKTIMDSIGSENVQIS